MHDQGLEPTTRQGPIGMWSAELSLYHEMGFPGTGGGWGGTHKNIRLGIEPIGLIGVGGMSGR